MDLLDWTPQQVDREIGVQAGDRVRARRADWSNDMVGDDEHPVDPAPIVWLEGSLSIVRVDALDYWQFNINGQAVDPATLEPVRSAP
jgi:hypothetical protein